jgi:hypothetical protein
VVGVRPVGGVWHIHRLRPRSYGGASIDIGETGTVAAAWEEKNSSTVWTARRPRSGPWQPRIALSEAGQTWLVFSPHIAVSRDRTSTVVWYRSIDGGYDLQGAQRPTGGPWGVAESVSQGLSVAPTGFQLAMDSRGNTVVAWSHMELGASRIMVTSH